MHDNSSFGVGARLASELRLLVRQAAEPVELGESVKAQMNRAWVNLGHPDWWRLRAAWWGDAGRWTGEAVEDFRLRFRALEERRTRLRHARESQSADILKMAERLSRLRQALAQSDPEFFGEEIDALEHVLRGIGDGNS